MGHSDYNWDLLLLFVQYCVFVVSDSYDVTKGNFGEDNFNEVKLTEQLVEKKNNLNSFSFKHYQYHKTKLLVKKVCPSIAREI